MLERLFVGWRQPLLPQTVRLLQERYAHGSVWDMSTVLPAGAEDATTVSVGLSPTVSLDATGAEGWADPVTGYWKPGGKAIDTATAYRAAFPIELTSPDVFKNPTLGDGGNQYVYDHFSGELHVPIHVAVTGGSHDDAVWLNGGEKVPISPSHVDVVVVPELPNVIWPTEWWAVGNGLEPNIVRPFNTVETGDFLSLGLPGLVRDFGDKTVTLKVDGHDSQVAHIQTFFPALADNHPNPDGDPNWFYYYQQVYNPEVMHNGNSVATVYNPDYNVRWLGLTYINNNGVTNDQKIDPTNWMIEIQLAPKVVTEPAPIPVFNYLFKTNASGQEEKEIKRIGYLNIGGIHRYEHILAHEQAHVKMIENLKNKTVPYGAPGFADKDTGQMLNLDWHWTDTDGDGIPDDEEKALGLDPARRDSTESFPEYAPGGAGELSSGDQECLVEIYALGEVINHAYDWHFDWAYEGSQYGPRPPYDRGPLGVPEESAPFSDFFPFRYDPGDGSPRSAYPPLDPRDPQHALTKWEELR